MNVTVYTSPGCQPCKLTKKKFDKLGIPYVEASAIEHRDQLASLGYLRAPVVVADFGDGATASWSDFRPTCIQELYATLSDKMVTGRVILPESA